MANPYAGRKEKTGDDLHPVDAINEAAGALHTLSQQLEEIKKLKVASVKFPDKFFLEKGILMNL